MSLPPTREPGCLLLPPNHDDVICLHRGEPLFTVAIDACQLWPGQVGGVETYLRTLVNYLPCDNDPLRYTLLAHATGKNGLEKFLDHTWQTILLPSPPPKNVSYPTCYRLKRKFAHWLKKPYPPTPHEKMVNRIIETAEIDLVHFPQTIIYPLSLDVPCVLTFWDMQHEFFPEFFSDAILKWRLSTYEPSVHKARLIIVASNFTKQSLIDKYNVSPEQIRVIPFGVSMEFQQALNKSTLSRFMKLYSLPEKYFFYPAASYPHKNHIRLLQAFKRMKSSYPDVKLVLTGMAHDAEHGIQQMITDLDLTSTVLKLGYIPYEHLPCLYAGALGLVFPSLFEGYGIPVLEAMTLGCPVICSNTTSLPELVGEAALTIDPLDIDAIVCAMQKMLRKPALRQSLTEAGQQRAKAFTWSQAAVQTAAVYREVLEQ